MNTFRDFIAKIVKERGIDEAPEIMEQIYRDLEKRVESKINLKIMQHLPEEKIPEFAKLLEGENKEEEIQKFLAVNINNLETIVAEELVLFQALYLSK